MNLNCQYFEKCSGCNANSKDYALQLKEKIDLFKLEWSKKISKSLKISRVRQVEDLKHRDKTDLTFKDGKCGFYNKNKTDVLDIENCPLFSKELEKFYCDFRKKIPKIKKGSIRLRVSPEGKRGIWIDFANLDIKELLEERDYFLFLSKISDIIEIGQKRKLLDIETFKLTEGSNFPWFESYTHRKNRIPLKMRIGSFSQTGFKTNYLLIDELQRAIADIPSNLRWFEVCCGSGNLTIGVVEYTQSITSTEFDIRALNDFKETVKGNYDLKKKISLKPLNFQKDDLINLNFFGTPEVLLIDPPRSGVGDFFKKLCDSENSLNYIVYVSCFGRSLLEDIIQMEKMNFSVLTVSAIDQFPFSSHMEWIVILKKQVPS